MSCRCDRKQQKQPQTAQSERPDFSAKVKLSDIDTNRVFNYFLIVKQNQNVKEYMKYQL